MGADDKWLSRDSSPVVRPYTVTGGRTEPADGEVLDLMTVVSARRSRGARPPGLGPEYRAIIRMCRHPVTVADVAAETQLPLGVVRVLLADLIEQSQVNVIPQRPAEEQPSAELLKEVLRGLRAL